jgi:tetratricopeptide (TPR) repeat protein
MSEKDVAQPDPRDKAPPTRPRRRRRPPRVRTSTVLLAANTAAMLAVAGALLWPLGRRPRAASGDPPVGAGPNAAPADQGPPAAAEPSPDPGRAVSWQQARAAFAAGEYRKALADYAVLHALAKPDPSADLMLDLFDLRRGQCLLGLGRADHARKRLTAAAASRSPLVRCAANYELALQAEREQRYLRARWRACLASAVTVPVKAARPLAEACDALVARVLTKKTLSFYVSEALVPWSRRRAPDPFARLEASALRRVLAEGSAPLAASVLAPKIARDVDARRTARWTVTTCRAQVGQLLGRFATRAKVDLRWIDVGDSARQRPVTLHLEGVSAQRVCEVAAGAAGLIARFTGDAIEVHDPLQSESLNQQRALLLRESISAWRRLCLRMGDAPRIAEGHFALGVLEEFAGEDMAAVNEYKLTADRFRESRVAPLALLRSARVRIRLQDYAGAQTDLTALLDRYPQCNELAEAYAALGEAAMRAGHFARAFEVFKGLYYRDLSPASKRYGCYGAGRCLYRLQAHDRAATWLNRYVRLALSGGGERGGRRLPGEGTLAEAYLLMAQNAVAAGHDDRAIDAFHLALRAGLRGEEAVGAKVALAAAHARKGNALRTIGILAGIDPAAATADQRLRIVLLAAETYRAMALPRRAASHLRRHLPTITDPAARARVGMALGRCYRQAGQLRDAHEALTEVLPALPPGAPAHEAACDLAEVCLALDKPDQAIAVLQALPDPAAAPAAWRRTRLFARAHLARRRYRQAALALAALPQPAAPESAPGRAPQEKPSP